MRYYIEYKFINSDDEYNIYFRDKEDYFNTLYCYFILDKENKISILDFGISHGWNDNEH